MLNRRSFMKMVGAIVAMPSALLKGKASVKPPAVEGGRVVGQEAKCVISHNWTVDIGEHRWHEGDMVDIKAYCNGEEFPAIFQKGGFVLPLKKYQSIQITTVASANNQSIQIGSIDREQVINVITDDIRRGGKMAQVIRGATNG